MFLDQFPYTNMHEINLDWIIQQVKAIDPKVIAALQQLDPDVIAQVTEQVEKANQYAISAQSASSAASASAENADKSDSSAAASASSAAGYASSANQAATDAESSKEAAATSASNAASVANSYTSGYHSNQTITFNSDVQDNWTYRLYFGSPSFVFLFSRTYTLNSIAANTTLFILPEDCRPANDQPIIAFVNNNIIDGIIKTSGEVSLSTEIGANTYPKFQVLICTKYR